MRPERKEGSGEKADREPFGGSLRCMVHVPEESGNGRMKKKPGDALLSHGQAAVPSAKRRFTFVFGMGTSGKPETEDRPPRPLVLFRERERQYGQASRLISTGRLNTLPCLHLQPIEQVVSLFPSGPSWGRGCLILRRASRLDAFSGYPFRTWLPGSCPWQDNRHTRGPSTSVLSY